MTMQDQKTINTALALQELERLPQEFTTATVAQLGYTQPDARVICFLLCTEKRIEMTATDDGYKKIA